MSFATNLRLSTSDYRRIAASGSAVAFLVFVLDLWGQQVFAVGVGYVVVILIAARAQRRSWVLTAALVCTLLVVSGYVLAHGLERPREPLVRSFVGFSAVVASALFAWNSLAASETLRGYTTALDQAHDSVIVTDLAGVVVYWNKGASELYGWVAAEALGRPATELMTTDVALPTVGYSGFAQDGSWQGDITIFARDGASKTVHCRCLVLRDDKQRPTGVLTTANDITARNVAQAELEATRIDLAHAARLSALGELTASIAHEVNQPLGGILSNAQASLRWLKRTEPQIDDAIRSVEAIVAETRRAGSVIQGIRALAKKQPPDVRVFDLSELVGETLELLRSELRRNGVSLGADLSTADTLVAADRVQIQQVVINLAINAVQAMSAVPSPQRLLKATCAAADGSAELTIADTGPGIPPDVMGGLFTAFVTTKPDGMGLGLSVCFSIVGRYGGRIWGENSDEGGARMRVRLPLHATEER